MSERLAGLLLPAFSPRRVGDLGIGDTRALKEWIELAADHGIGFLQLLPINETGADDSPYNAISSVALDPLYLTMEEVPGMDRGMLERHVGDVDRSGQRVDYPAVRRAKNALLRSAWERWSASASEFGSEYEEFRRSEASWLEDYAIFRTLMDEAKSEAWDHWPAEWQSVEGARAAAEGREDERSYFAWIQWLCFRQWRQVKEHADSHKVKLMGDIPIGVSRYSSDVFFGREDFDLDWCGGAPPETMFKHDRFIQKWGQNWGIPLYRWDKMEKEGFPWWRQRIDKLTDVFRIFRIDHILGFYRIYAFPWRPQQNGEFLELTEKQAAERTGGELPGWSPRPDDTEVNKEANRDDGDGRLKVIQEAAGDAAVVGEDLGCVPDYVRPHLASLGIAGFRIPQWDYDELGHVIPGEDLPECSFATYATHDHDSIPAMWDELRRQTEDPELEESERRDAIRMLGGMAEFAEIGSKRPFDEQVKWRLIDALMSSRSHYAAIMVNDLFSMRDRINQPGTVGPHNWTFRLPWTAAECREDPEWRHLKRSIAAAGRAG